MVGAQKESKISCSTNLLSVSFIQACRNNLRLDLNATTLNDQDYLLLLYKLGHMTYLYEGCAAADALGSAKVSNSPDKYVSVQMNFKARALFTPTMQRDAVDAMIVKLGSSTTGICILVLINLNNDVSVYEATEPNWKQPARSAKKADANKGATISDRVTSALQADLAHADCKVVARIVRIPSNDRFGVTAAVNSATRAGSEIAEVYSSHVYVP